MSSSTHVQRTFVASALTQAPAWYLVDAKDQTLGRLAVNLARVLRGKHRSSYTPHSLCGDFVVVVNADRVHVTGNKMRDKVYDRYSGYPGGRRERTFEEAISRDATFPLHEAVRGMLGHNTLGGRQLRRLKVYAGPEHPHAAQQPVAITFGDQGQVITL